MGDLTDRYVLTNVAGCAVALAIHVALRLGLLASPFLGFAIFVPTFLCFGATMATHPQARVTRVGPLVLGVRMDWTSVLRTTPRWSLVITLGFLIYLGWFFVTSRAAMQAESGPPLQFAAMFSGVCAHLLWSGVGTRLGALRVNRERVAING